MHHHGHAYGGNAMMAMGMGMGMGSMNMMNNPNYFFFAGNSLSLQTRLETMTDEEINRMSDASITVTGIEIKPVSMMSLMCTTIWGSILIFPMFFMCCGWWKRCTYAIY
jgi:hypothetical protein